MPFMPQSKVISDHCLTAPSNTTYSDDSPDSMNNEFPSKALFQLPLQVTEDIAMISALLLSDTPTLL